MATVDQFDRACKELHGEFVKLNNRMIELLIPHIKKDETGARITTSVSQASTRLNEARMWSLVEAADMVRALCLDDSKEKVVEAAFAAGNVRTEDGLKVVTGGSEA